MSGIAAIIQGEDGSVVEGEDGSYVQSDGLSFATYFTKQTPADIQIVWNQAQGRGDWVMNGPDLLTGNDLQTAILVSVFTDRIASSDYTPPPPSKSFDRRGWWCDTYNTLQIGSRLWQLNRAIKTNSTTLLLLAQDYATEALQWLIDQNIVKSFTITAQWYNLTFISLSITAAPPQGLPQTFLYSWVWENG